MKNLYAYALVKSLYDANEDYIDSFWPLLISSFPSAADQLTTSEMQEAIRAAYEIDIPIHPLRTIAQRAQKLGHLELVDANVRKEHQRFRLSPKGAKYVAKLEKNIEVDTRLSDLYASICEYIREKSGEILDIDSAKLIVHDFISHNIDLVASFIMQDTQFPTSRDTDTEYDELLISYIRQIESIDPKLLETFKDILLGSYLIMILTTDDLAAVEKSFGKCVVYLDSNIMFSLFDFDHDEVNQSAHELLAMLKDFGFECRIFSVTIDEMSRLVAGYSSNVDKYIVDFEVDSVYYVMKKKGWKRSDALEFIASIDERISELGINITVNRGLDIGKYKPSDLDDYSKIGSYKRGRPINSINHDLFVIEAVRDLRGRECRRIEDAKYIFLTADVGLSRYDYIENGHKDNGTVCTVVLDQLLTTLLWLKNPKGLSDIPFSFLLAAHSRHLFINRIVWDQFAQTVAALKENGDIDDDDIYVLLYDGQIGTILKNMDDSEANKINSGFVLQQLETSKQSESDKVAHIIKEKEIHFWNQAERKIAESRDNDMYKFMQKVEAKKKTIREDADRKAQAYSWIVISILILCILVVIVSLWVFRVTTAKAIINIIVSIVGCIGFAAILRSRVRIQTSIYDSLERRKTEELLEWIEEFLAEQADSINGLIHEAEAIET